MAKKKSNLQKKKADPKSSYWRKKADSLWGELIHSLYSMCDVGRTGEGPSCSGNLEAHHLISRGNRATRHNVINGILLCSSHHKFSNKLSAHGAPLAFSEWLQTYRSRQWGWCSENKFKIGEYDYKQAYEDLMAYRQEKGL